VGICSYISGSWDAVNGLSISAALGQLESSYIPNFLSLHG
jgi:hypothetical protein